MRMGRDKQEQDGIIKLQSRRVQKNTNLMSRIDHSQSSNHLAFCSQHKHQNKQCGTKLHKSIFRCLLNLPCQEANSSLNLYTINQWIHTKQTKYHRTQLICYRTMKKKVIHQFATPFIHKAPI